MTEPQIGKLSADDVSPISISPNFKVTHVDHSFVFDARQHLLSQNDAFMSREELLDRIESNMPREKALLDFRYCDNKADNWVVVGAGPSAADHLPAIRKLKRQGANIISVNKTHDWLLDRGIVPWGHVLLDGHDWVAEYVKKPRKDVRYFVASQCHPQTFDNLDGCPVFMWHAGQDFPEGAEPDRMFHEKGYGVRPIIGGGTTVGQRVPIIGVALGARRFHMIGFDSCRRDGKLHVTPKPDLVDPSQRRLMFKHKGFGYIFDTNVHMARQQMDFDKFLEDYTMRLAQRQIPDGFRLIFYGSGLTPFWAATVGLHADERCNAEPTRVGGWIETRDLDPHSARIVVSDVEYQPRLSPVSFM